MEKPDLIVIAWYRRGDYPRIYALAPDGGGLEPTFDEWERFVLAALPAIEARGVPIRKVIVEPDVLEAWLEAKGLKSTPETRARFVHEVAQKRHGTH